MRSDLCLTPCFRGLLRRRWHVSILLLKVINEVDASDYILKHCMPQPLIDQGLLADTGRMSATDYHRLISQGTEPTAASIR